MSEEEENYTELEETVLTVAAGAPPDPPAGPRRFSRAALSVAAVVVVLAVASGIGLLMSHDAASNHSLGPTPGATRRSGSESATAAVSMGLDQQQSSGKPSSSAGTDNHTTALDTFTEASTEPAHIVLTQGPGSERPRGGGTASGGVIVQRSRSGPPRVTTSAPVAPASSSPTIYTEEAYNKHGVPTFSDYSNASGQGQDIPFQQNVQVICKVYNTNIPSVLPGGYWYKIATAPWTDLYAAANTFLNGLSPTSPSTVYFDPRVPDC